MTTVVNEPYTGYNIVSWQQDIPIFPFDDLICEIENAKIISRQPSSVSKILFARAAKRKLSTLRGKMSMQNEEEIDEQISELRSEWDRNI